MVVFLYGSGLARPTTSLTAYTLKDRLPTGDARDEDPVSRYIRTLVVAAQAAANATPAPKSNVHEEAVAPVEIDGVACNARGSTIKGALVASDMFCSSYRELFI